MSQEVTLIGGAWGRPGDAKVLHYFEKGAYKSLCCGPMNFSVDVAALGDKCGTCAAMVGAEAAKKKASRERPRKQAKPQRKVI